MWWCACRFTLFTEVFNVLPLASCIAEKVHSGRVMVIGRAKVRVSHIVSSRAVPARLVQTCCLKSLASRVLIFSRVLLRMWLWFIQS